jgi:hypothetical protein
MPTFETLPFNRVAVFDTPVFVGCTAVRTGTIDDSLLSFFASILYACSKKFLLAVESKERIIQVNNFKDYIFDKISQSKEFSTFNENFSDHVFNTIKHFYNFIENKEEDDISKQDAVDLKKIVINLIDDEEKFELYQLITELIPISGGFNKIFNHSLKKWSGNFVIKNFETLLMKETMKYLKYKDVLDQAETEQVNFIKKNVLNFLHEIIEISKRHFIEPKLPTTLEPVVINTISTYFECDIYFLDSKTRLPFISENYKISNLKSIIILSFDNKQYEVVGKKLKNNAVQREFMPFDDIVKTIQYYLNKQNKSRNINDLLDINDDGIKDEDSEEEFNIYDEDEKENLHEDVEENSNEDDVIKGTYSKQNKFTNFYNAIILEKSNEDDDDELGKSNEDDDEELRKSNDDDDEELEKLNEDDEELEKSNEDDEELEKSNEDDDELEKSNEDDDELEKSNEDDDEELEKSNEDDDEELGKSNK